MSEPTDIKRTPGRVSRAASVVATSAAVGASWMALVAATTMGLGHLDRVRAEVSAPTGALGTGSARYRLVVQSYARESVPLGNMPSARQKPLASAQRAVTGSRSGPDAFILRDSSLPTPRDPDSWPVHSGQRTALHRSRPT